METTGLDRFAEAQTGVHDRALAELQQGRKQSHWMWFVFPQLRGLGRSEMAWRYGIADAAEAAAYLEHPLLGQRLRQCTEAVLGHHARSAEAIFGPVDAMKFRSSMTLFEAVSADKAAFAQALEQFFGGARDAATLARLRSGS